MTTTTVLQLSGFWDYPGELVPKR